jgi:hypothetical protein
MELAETAGTYEHANRVIDLALVSWLLQDFSMFYHVLPGVESFRFAGYL